MPIHKGQILGYGRLLNTADVLSLTPFGSMEDFGLPSPTPEILAMFAASDFPNLTSTQHSDVLDLLDQYKDIFATGPADFGLAKGLIHQIHTGDAPPF